MSVIEIAKTLKIPYTTVRAWFPQTEITQRIRDKKLGQRIEAIELRKQGLIYDEIAEKVGVHYQTIFRWFNEPVNEREEIPINEKVNVYKLNYCEKVKDSLEEEELKEIMHKIIENKLSSREKIIVKLRFGFVGKKYTLEEISKLLKVTRERVRQLEKGLLEKLKDNTEISRELVEYL